MTKTKTLTFHTDKIIQIEIKYCSNRNKIQVKINERKYDASKKI